MRRTGNACCAGLLIIAIVAMIGCGGGGGEVVSRAATAQDVVGDWFLDVFFTSGGFTVGDYFGDDDIFEVDAEFGLDRTFTMRFQDVASDFVGMISGTWELPTSGDLTLNYPDRSQTYTALWVDGWLYLRATESGNDVRLYFR